ncbi:FAD-linked oxidase [Haloprofundus marisrubri]|uniref:FAD-linked oxidase n=1 Tax=Haloprofundus marisrubri TaxID=1514971 RepID=A0A0W1R5T8_9EURY|nr:FAD-binding oxidoreductase [Haloprofundus marisrubri]KTG08776.1 FAD-linked oxidase [Haloprofundus marisrubri]
MSKHAEQVLDTETVETLGSKLRGDALHPTDEGYDDARTIWNAMIDRYPAIIAQCAGTADVMTSLAFARDNDLEISVRGGGHNIAGNAVCDDGMMIDLSPMSSVRIDPERKIARVGPGATLADFDHEAQMFGLATPVGYNSTTGIAGLTLGGGFGWLSRKFGLTLDNLRAADVVTADVRLRHASEDENPDLFWGIRGGGGNFGIVTSFEFDLHEVGPEILSGVIVHPLEDASDRIHEYRELAADAPDEVTVWFVIRHAPPLPIIPEEWHGEKVLIFAAYYHGGLDEGERALEPFRDLGDPIADAIGPHQYAEWQGAFDPLLAPGARNYWKSHNFEEMTDGMISTFVEYAETIPTPHTEIAVAQLGGATNRVPVDATAYPHRDAEFLMNLHTRWEEPEQDEMCIEWARDLHEAMKPHATGGVYVNFIPEDVGEERAAYRENYERLTELKARYDPDNVFSMNQNVEPSA